MPISRRSRRPSPAGPWWTPREQVVGTRVVGILVMGGAGYLLLNIAISPQWHSGQVGALPVSILAAGLLAATSAVPALVPAAAPRWTAIVMSVFAVVVVFSLNLYTQDATYGAQAYLAWPALYSAYHLRTSAAWLLTGLCVAFDVTLLAALGGTASVLLDAPAFAVTVGFLTWMLTGARDRSAQLHDRLRAEADHDPLTHLANRRVLDAALTARLAGGLPTAVLLADIDHFKRVNDTQGHAVGDEVLRAVSHELRAACRAGDVVSRFGGDELAVVLEDASLDGVTALAERFRSAVERLRVHGVPGVTGELLAPVQLTVSIGLAVFDPAESATSTSGPCTPHCLMSRADRALYQAKDAGRNRVALTDHSDAVDRRWGAHAGPVTSVQQRSVAAPGVAPTSVVPPPSVVLD